MKIIITIQIIAYVASLALMYKVGELNAKIRVLKILLKDLETLNTREQLESNINLFRKVNNYKN